MGVAVRFRAGAAVVRRDVLDGRVWSAQAARVLADDGDDLAIGYWPGAEGLAPRAWLRWSETQADSDRAAYLHDYAERRWALGHRRWRTTNVVHHMSPGRWFSINALHHAPAGDLAYWTVNFERPFERTARSVDTLDLLLDIVVMPDLSWRWKGEDEYRHACRIGAVSAADAAAVDRARQEAVALLESGGPPVRGPWSTWRPAADWATPELPPSVGELVTHDRVPTGAAGPASKV